MVLAEGGCLKGTVKKRLVTFQKVVYSHCSEECEVEESRTVAKPKSAIRRQVAKGKLREKHRALRKQMAIALLERKSGILTLMDDIRKEILVISKAEYQRK